MKLGAACSGGRTGVKTANWFLWKRSGNGASVTPGGTTTLRFKHACSTP